MIIFPNRLADYIIQSMGSLVDLAKRRAEDESIRQQAVAFVAERLAAAREAKFDQIDILTEIRTIEQAKLALLHALGGSQRPLDALARETVAEVERQLARFEQSTL